MGGTIHEAGNAGPHAEFNMAADPLAAREVLAAAPAVTLVPLDVTRKLRATPEALDRLTAAGATSAQTAFALIRAYFAAHADRSSRPLHDPCVMLLALAPGLFGTQILRLSIGLDDHPGRLLQGPDGAPVEVALSVDVDAALELLWRGLGAAD
jgi:purine nucleosidase/pyrimidine-specific ribonucleoside hydrolase